MWMFEQFVVAAAGLEGNVVADPDDDGGGEREKDTGQRKVERTSS